MPLVMNALTPCAAGGLARGNSSMSTPRQGRVAHLLWRTYATLPLIADGS